MRKIFLIIMPFFLVSCGTKNNYSYIKITSVHDGDTITDSNGVKYRILGADTPEVSGGYNFKPTTGIESIYGKLATKFTRDLLLNKTVRIKRVKKDKYNRQVAQIFVNEQNQTLSELLIERGLARVAYISSFHTNLKYKKAPDYFFEDENYIKKLYDKQLYAASNKIGLWNDISKFKIIFPKSS